MSKLEEAYDVWVTPLREDKSAQYTGWDEWWGPIDGMPDKAFKAGALWLLEQAKAYAKDPENNYVAERTLVRALEELCE